MSSTYLTADFSFNSSSDGDKENEDMGMGVGLDLDLEKSFGADFLEEEPDKDADVDVSRSTSVTSGGEDEEIVEVNLVSDEENGQRIEYDDEVERGTGDVDGGVSSLENEEEEMDVDGTGTVIGEVEEDAATNAATTTTGGNRLISEVSSRETRTRSKRNYAPTPSDVSLFQEEEADEASRSVSSRSVTINPDTDDGEDEDHNTDRGHRRARRDSGTVSSQISRGGNVGNVRRDEVNIDLAYLKTGELALVWYNGNEDFPTFTSKKAKDIQHQSLAANLVHLCEMVDKILPVLMKSLAERGPRSWKNNIKLSHVGLLLKGLMVMQRMQLQACKKSMVIEYEKLRKPVRISEIDLPADAANQKKKRRGETTIAGDSSFGAFNMELAAQSYDPTPRAAAGGEYLESTVDAGYEVTKTKKRRKAKSVKEKDIMQLLEQRGEELRQNAGGNTLTGAGIDLPPPSRGDFTDLMESCQFLDFGLDRQDSQEGERQAKEPEKNANEKSPPPPQKKPGKDPPVPRKRARLEASDFEIARSSFGLDSVIDELDDNNPKSKKPRRRRLLFNKIDKDRTISIEALKQQMNQDPKTKEKEQRQRRNDCITKPSSAIELTGLQLINGTGRRIPSAELQCMVKENIPKVADIVRRTTTDTEVQKKNKKHAKRVEKDAEMEIVRDRPTPEEEVQGLVEEVPIINEFGMPEEVNFPNGDNVHIDFGDAEFMVPRQAEPIANSEDTQERNIDVGEAQVQEKVACPAERSFADIVGVGANKAKAVRIFGILLKMQGQRKILLIQDEAYGEIRIQQLLKK